MCVSFLVLHLSSLLFCCSTVVWHHILNIDTHFDVTHWLDSNVHLGDISLACLIDSCLPRHPFLSSWQRLWWWAHKWMCDTGGAACSRSYQSSIHYSVGVHMVGDVIRELITFSSERMDVWLWSHQPWTSEAGEMHPSSWVLGVPLIGDHVFVPDRLWNGVLLHGCVTPASHQGDWLVWSCGMFPSGPQ